MNSLFIDDLVSRLQTEFDVVNVWDQKSLRDWFILDGEQYYNFPMICFEYTQDSNEKVEIMESKFLNYYSHEGTWIIGGTEDSITFIINLQDINKVLDIDVFEISQNSRGEGIGGNVLSVIESVAEDYFKSIRVSPFDTDAINFWEHMDYIEKPLGYWEKKLCW